MAYAPNRKNIKDHFLIIGFGVMLFLFLLAPYFDVNGSKVNGGVLGLAGFLLVGLPALNKALHSRRLYLLLSILMGAAAIHSIGVLLSGTSFDFIFVGILIKVFFYVLVGVVIGYTFQDYGLERDKGFMFFVRGIVMVTFFNAFVVVFGFFFPEFKAFSEALLFYDPSMNINYEDHDFRLRGLASAGGASLSVFHAIGLLSAIWLFGKKIIGIGFFLVIFSAIGVSIIFIGRTGLFLIPAGLLFIFSFYLVQGRFPKKMLYSLVIFCGTSLLFINFSLTLIPQNVYNYTISLLTNGTQALEQEGTVARILSFYHFPNSVKEFFWGAGDFSGSFTVDQATDSGYMKTFTAVGFLGGALLYASLATFALRVFKSAKRGRDEFLYGALLLTVIFSAEIKEPFFLQGYSARAFFSLVGILVAYSSTRCIKRAGGDHRLTWDAGTPSGGGPL